MTYRSTSFCSMLRIRGMARSRTKLPPWSGSPRSIRSISGISQRTSPRTGFTRDWAFWSSQLRAGRFVVLDGNRRLAAIKLLASPGSAPESWRPITTDIEVDLASFEELPCTILDSREQGRLWLERMHTGRMNGVGVVDWPPIAQHHFSPRNDQRGRGAAALAWLSSRTKPGKAALHEAIEAVEEGEITTFGRFVQTTAVRPILGYDFQNSELVPTEGTSETVLYERLIAAVADLAGGKDVNDLRTKEQRVAYAHSLAGSSESDDKREPQVQEEPTAQETDEPAGEQSADDDQEPANESEPQEETKPKRRRRPSQPKPSVLDAPLPDVFKPRIVRISEELCDLNVHKTPNSVAVLLRLLIEMTTEQCRHAEGLPKKGDLNERIQRVINRVQTPQDQQNNVFHGVTVSLRTPNDRDHTKNFNQHVPQSGLPPCADGSD